MHSPRRLHFNTLPLQLDIEQIEEYLLMVKKRNKTASESFFKHTVYGLRFLFRCEGRDAREALFISERAGFPSLSWNKIILLCPLV